MDIDNGISIIVPVYNASKYLRFTLDSILSQTYTNYELILVNDGSTDESEKVCKEYVSKDNRVSYYYKTNGGVSSARNFGMNQAKCKWITFVDNDDYLCQEYLETMVNSAEDFDYDWIISTYRMIRRDALIHDGIDAYMKIAGINDLSSKSISDCTKMFPELDAYPGVMSCNWRKFYKSDIIRRYNIKFLDIQSEDELFDMQYSCHICSFRSIRYAGYCYIASDISQCHNSSYITEMNWINLVWQCYAIIKERFGILNQDYWDRICTRMLLRYSAYIRKGYFKSTRMPFLTRINRWKVVADDPYFRKMKWKHTWIPSTKICYVICKMKTYLLGDVVFHMIDGKS